MRLGMNKPAMLLRLVVILLAATVIYHSFDISFEHRLAHSWALSFTWEGLLDQVIDTVILAGLMAALESFLLSLRKLLYRIVAWIGICHAADQNISPMALSIGGHAPPTVC